MREIRLHGSEGGGAETNRSFLPLSTVGPFFLDGGVGSGKKSDRPLDGRFGLVSNYGFPSDPSGRANALTASIPEIVPTRLRYGVNPRPAGRVEDAPRDSHG